MAINSKFFDEYFLDYILLKYYQTISRDRYGLIAEPAHKCYLIYYIHF